MNISILILLALAFNLINAALYDPRFEINLDRFEQIFANESFADFSNIKVRKVNGTRALVGYAMLYVPLGDDVMLDGTVLKKQGKKNLKIWKIFINFLNFQVVNIDFCHIDFLLNPTVHLMLMMVIFYNF